MDEIELDFVGEAGGTPVDIDFVGMKAFGFKENLMGGLIGKLDKFVLDRWAVTGTDTLDLAGIHGRSMEIRVDDFGGALCGRGEMAGQLAKGRSPAIRNVERGSRNEGRGE